MSAREKLPGRWLDLTLAPAGGGAGIGPALGFLAGALASGRPLWSWPSLGFLLLGLFLSTAVWGRLWACFGTELRLPTAGPSPAPLAPGGGSLPYTVPGSLSAHCEAALRRAWATLCRAWSTMGSHWAETAGLAVLLLTVAALRGQDALLVAVAGLALLGLRRLVRGRPAALALLGALGGVAWPWWLGHTAWAPLKGDSLLVSMLWGVAYAGWACLGEERAAGQPLLAIDLGQGAVVLFFLLAGRPVVGMLLAFTLLGQGLLQAALVRRGRLREVPARTWPPAAVGMLLAGLAAGGWI